MNSFFLYQQINKVKLIKDTIPQYWTGIDFIENVLLVLTVEKIAERMFNLANVRVYE